jgi:surfactin synthase thioesterase subunit
VAPIKLFCFPYAGASAWVFNGLAHRLSSHFEVIAVDLPGRGKRRTQPPADDWATLVRMLASELKQQLDRPYALLGYSFGALVAFEIMHELSRQPGVRVPAAFAACAAPGPSAMRQGDLHLLDDNSMFEALCHLGGIPEEVLASPELIALAAPILRADLRLFELYRRGNRAPCTVPITTYYGSDDSGVDERHLAWQMETSAPFRTRRLAGGHMFLHDAEEAFAEALIADFDRCRPTVEML